MPVQRIVMPDGSTRAFPEHARPVHIRDAIEEMLYRMEEEGHPACRIVTQYRGDDEYYSPDPSNAPDVEATEEQRALAIGQVQALPKNTEGYEWSSTYKNGAFSKWGTLKHQSRSTIDGSGDFHMHYHTPLPDLKGNRKNYFPGPGDPAAVFKTGKPGFIITPDRNTLVEFGIRDGRYFARPVWQREGTANKRDYEKWQPDNLRRR